MRRIFSTIVLIFILLSLIISIMVARDDNQDYNKLFKDYPILSGKVLFILSGDNTKNNDYIKCYFFYEDKHNIMKYPTHGCYDKDKYFIYYNIN